MVCDGFEAEKLVSWFRANRRSMPWRDDPTPYHVWVSEIMLQQTRVDTVIPYYLRFTEALPDLKALASCEDDRLNKLWEGLGYYSRARNLKKAAERCMEEYGGQVPDSFEALLSLPGIGTYTAGAVASIAFHRKTPVVDGNVLRVLSRLNASREDIRDAAVKTSLEKELRAFLQEAEQDTGEFNQALMELGALVCVPNGAPKCAVCPWKDDCRACLEGLTDVIPVISPKENAKTVGLTVLIYRCGKKIGLEKRPRKGLLSGLYGLPALDGKKTEQEVRAYLAEAEASYTDIIALPDARHVFTHRVWDMAAYCVTLEEELPGLVFATQSELNERYALPSAFKKWNLTELIKELT
ncbi:MAG: A/G-specific adenine glycosylase [Lachnospiraceae bacterium]|nr:A/G-specific adenine glycosylase [Lachnospiraceae bacterium]